MSNKQITLLGLLTLFLVAACSTEKNTLLSRSYHSTTAHYNGYFNANDLLSEAMKSYRGNLKEDYYSVLTIRTLPNEEEVKTMYTPIDTAIAKCTKVIQKHAMPGMDKPSKKKEEHNKWIDENWTTIGIANYYRRDYALAMKNFEYVQKFFSNDKSTYVAELWMAKTNIQEGRFTEANFNLANLDKAVEESTSKSKKSKSKSKKSKKSKKADKEDEVAEFPKKMRFELEITRAQFFEAKKDVDGEIKALEASLEFVKKSSDKARIHFILGQLYEGKGDRGGASDHYNKALKSNGGYEMNFNARLKRALNGGSSDVEKDLNKMLRDEKNAEFKDQIYYTLGLISQNEGKEDKAIERFTSSAFYSTNNNRQKGMAYERLGDTYFQKKDYVKAQKYYDSCATVIPETYPNAEGVRNKALKLQDLVTAIETAQYEDSVQRIASLSEEDRYAFAEKLVKQIKEEEERQKRLNDDRARQLQELANKAEEGAGNKWYWNNPKAKEEGFKEFKRQWGQRVNEDDWRRSDKVVLGFNNEDDTLGDGGNKPVEVEAVDSLTPESLLAKLPLSDSLLQGSRERMMSAYFDAGRIYQDQLNEEKLAEKQYNIILGKQFESDYKLLSAYQIYKMYDPAAPQAVEQKNYILTNYPTSDFAGYLRDPDYFLKKKEREKLAQQEYLTVLDRYERGLYYPVLLKANTVITGEKENQYRAKYFLLKAKCQAKLNEDKKTLLPTLDSLIAEYPGTDEAKNATDMRNIILNGYSANLTVDFNKPSMYKYNENDEMNVLVFLEADSKVSSTVAKTRVADFNKEFYGREKLMTSSKVFGKQSVILVKEFKSEDEAAMYLAQFKKTKKHLLDLQKAKIVFISTPNMKTLFETMKLEEYERFFEDKY